MSFSLQGKVTWIGEPVTGEGKKGDWARRDFVIKEVIDEYPQSAKFTLFKSGEYLEYATDKFQLNVGDLATVEFSLENREYEGNQYTNLKAFKVTRDEAGSATEATPQEEPSTIGEEEESDLPF